MSTLLQLIGVLTSFQLKQKLQGPAAKLLPTLGSSDQDFACPMFEYRDLLFLERNIHNAHALRKLSCLHILNHLYKTRDRVIKNNARLAKDGSDVDLELRDQGFTRPKVLIILPTRQACANWVEVILSLCGPEQQENRKRFQDSYTKIDDALSGEKPEDFRELFGGNDDDMFRVGLKLTRKTLKYFSQFYSSDIIFASPLGLRMAIGADHADSLMMQNCEHVEYIFEHLNLQPKEAHGCDFGRVRNWYLDGNAKHLRQTMIFSAFNFPALNWLYHHHMSNVAGKMKVFRNHEGNLLELGNSIKQTFSRFECADPISEPDKRFTYFTTAIVPILNKYAAQSNGRHQGTLIYLPSYADFVRVETFWLLPPQLRTYLLALSLSILRSGTLLELEAISSQGGIRSFSTRREPITSGVIIFEVSERSSCTGFPRTLYSTRKL